MFLMEAVLLMLLTKEEHLVLHRHGISVLFRLHCFVLDILYAKVTYKESKYIGFVSLCVTNGNFSDSIVGGFPTQSSLGHQDSQIQFKPIFLI